MQVSVAVAMGIGSGLLLLLAPLHLFYREKADPHQIVGLLQRDRKGFLQRLSERLDKSHSGWSTQRYLAVSLTLGFVCFFMSSQLLQSWWLAMPTILAGILFTERLVSVFGARRRDRFEEGNVKAIRLMANSLRTSPSYLHAFEQVAASPYMDDLVKAEYRRIVELLRAQVPLEQVMQAFHARTGSQDAKYLATIVQIQREMGGDMAKTLDLAAFAILRRRQSLRRHKAAMAQIIAQVNLLSVMPFVFVTALYVNNPSHFDPLTETVSGRFLLLASLLCILVGGEAIRFVAQKSVHKGG
ncbi:type II secretion system F family protein [Brevibacillus sp. TJ4]|uniref:type II secretion system F family protein n=1 Tax=Brevibacillus sp. TJ4 TaxID=3234853 RepID=UPI0037D0725C